MKHRIFAMAATFAALIAMAVVSANAQKSARLEAHVPFDFAAGNSRLPAGDYSVTRIARNAFLLRTSDWKVDVIVQAPVAIEQRQNGSPARLVFRRYGSEYFLTQIWSELSGEGRQLNSSKTEDRLARQWKQKNTTAQLVDIVVRGK